MLITLVHLKTIFENFEFNFQQIRNSYIQAVQSYSDIVIFSETSFTGYNILSKKYDFIETEKEYQNKLHALVKQYKIPICIGALHLNSQSDTGTVSSFFKITDDLIDIIKEKERHTKLSHPYDPTFKYGGTISKPFEYQGTRFSTLICSETMDEHIVDRILEETPDIILNPSAFGEIPPYVNYPIVCSAHNLERLDCTLILSPNQMVNTEKYNLGRTIIRRGNNILFETSALKTTLIHFNTNTYDTTVKHLL
jgi:predicted amidohydrolase